MSQNRAVYVAIAIAVLALILAAVAVAYRPATSPAPQAPGQTPQVVISYKLNSKLPNGTTIEYNAAAYPFFPVLAGREPLLWFNATVSNGGIAVVEVFVSVGGHQFSQKYVVDKQLLNQPVYVDLTPYIQGTSKLNVNVYFVAYT